MKKLFILFLILSAHLCFATEVGQPGGPASTPYDSSSSTSDTKEGVVGTITEPTAAGKEEAQKYFKGEHKTKMEQRAKEKAEKKAKKAQKKSKKKTKKKNHKTNKKSA